MNFSLIRCSILVVLLLTLGSWGGKSTPGNQFFVR